MHMIACILLPLSQTDLWTPVCRFITVVVNSKLAKATDFEFLTRLVYTATSYARVNCSSQKKKKKKKTCSTQFVDPVWPTQVSVFDTLLQGSQRRVEGGLSCK